MNNNFQEDFGIESYSFAVASESLNYDFETGLVPNNAPDFMQNDSVSLELMAIESEAIIRTDTQEIVFIDSAIADREVLIDNISGASETE